nr:chloride channel protein [Actinocrinis puniceicyclus]
MLPALRESNGGLAVLAVTVGAGAGAGAIAFRWLIRTFTLLLSGHADYSAAGHAANPHIALLGRYFVLFAPVLAGLLYGPLVARFAPEARGHGVPEVMYAVARRSGRIGPQVAVVKSLASALCIGGGGSVGREGPIVQIGSALGSTLGMWLRVAQLRLRILVACGAAGGIAATFNAPMAGVFFAMELILRDFTAQSFGMVALASVTASVIGRTAFGDTPFLHLPAFHVQHLGQYALFALLGLLAGVVGVAFTRVLYAVEDLCDAVSRVPAWARPAVGGLALGALLLVLPQMYGVGYPVLANGVYGTYSVVFVLVLMFGKMVATSLTIGIGGSGGVFAPSLFIGAMFGSAFGQTAGHLLPALAGPPGAYALIGMGAVFAGSARAPITAVVIMFELTGDYTVILPLMAAIALATGASALISRDTIYTLKLRRRGIDLDAPVPAALLPGRTLRDVMEPAPTPLPEDTPLHKAEDRLSRARHGALPVVGSDGEYMGVLTAQAAAGTLTDERRADMTADIPVRELIFLPHVVTLETPLHEALDALVAAEQSGLPVLDESGLRLAGWITHQSLLAAVHKAHAVTRTVS